LSLIYPCGWMDEYVALVATNVRGDSPTNCHVSFGFCLFKQWWCSAQKYESCEHSGIQRMSVC
jgi:hypothetical protein